MQRAQSNQQERQKCRDSLFDQLKSDCIDEQAHAHSEQRRDDLSRVKAISGKDIQQRGNELIERQPETVQICYGKRSGFDFRAEVADVLDVNVSVTERVGQEECAQK